MRENRKAQAAMEFLMQYGWAILAFLLVFGALFYFGIFNTAALLPDKCLLPDARCLDHSITGNTVRIVLANDREQQMSVTGFTATSPDGLVSCNSTGGAVIPPGGKATLNTTCSGLAPQGARQRLNLDVAYQNPGGMTHKAVGELYSTVGP